MSIILPNLGCKLVFRNQKRIQEIIATHVYLNIPASRGQKHFWEGPYATTPLLEHEIGSANTANVVGWASNGDGKGLCPSNNIANAIDLAAISGLECLECHCQTHIFLELVCIRHAGAADPISHHSRITSGRISDLMQYPQILGTLELFCCICDEDVRQVTFSFILSNPGPVNES